MPEPIESFFREVEENLFVSIVLNPLERIQQMSRTDSIIELTQVRLYDENTSAVLSFNRLSDHRRSSDE